MTDQLTTMTEAVRLTRQGRLLEASALLQGRAARPSTAQPPARLSALLHGRAAASEGRSQASRATAGPDPAGLLSRLQAHLRTGSPGQPAPARRRDATPLPGETAHLTFSGPTGSRRYDLYVPSPRAAAPRPLMVMLHGGRQNAADFATGTRMSELAEQHGFLVAYPEQSRAANSGGYWNWFRPGDQRRDAGESTLR